jgi:hypothetical protein
MVMIIKELQTGDIQLLQPQALWWWLGAFVCHQLLGLLKQGPLSEDKQM